MTRRVRIAEECILTMLNVVQFTDLIFNVMEVMYFGFNVVEVIDFGFASFVRDF